VKIEKELEVITIKEINLLSRPSNGQKFLEILKSNFSKSRFIVSWSKIIIIIIAILAAFFNQSMLLAVLFYALIWFFFKRSKEFLGNKS
jgi:hypothetical protein